MLRKRTSGTDCIHRLICGDLISTVDKISTIYISVTLLGCSRLSQFLDPSPSQLSELSELSTLFPLNLTPRLTLCPRLVNRDLSTHHLTTISVDRGPSHLPPDCHLRLDVPSTHHLSSLLCLYLKLEGLKKSNLKHPTHPSSDYLLRFTKPHICSTTRSVVCPR